MSRSVRLKNEKKVHKDRMRPLRVLEYLDNSAVFDNSPIEVNEGFVISDRDTGELFLTLSFRCLSKQPIAKLNIRVHLYKANYPIPYQKNDYSYSWEDGTFGIRTLNGARRKEKECREFHCLECGEVFGEGIYLPIPDTYFKKLQVELLSVSYEDGREETLKLIAGSKALHFYELDEDLKDIYKEMNIFREAEAVHPIRVLPQEGENVWLCCCGNKNPSELHICEKCGRDKNWQMENLSVEKLKVAQEEEIRTSGRRVLHDTTAYQKNIENQKDIEEKVRVCNEVMEKLAIQEKEKDAKPTKIFIGILICMGAVALLYLLVYILYSYLSTFIYSQGDSDTLICWISHNLLK